MTVTNDKIDAKECSSVLPLRSFDVEDVRMHLRNLLRPSVVQSALGIMESGEGNICQRIAAASILALVGDPRIKPGAVPQLLLVDGGDASIGLDEDLVDEVAKEFELLGVQREWILKEVPAHRVNISPYYISKYPVTNCEYELFLGENPEIEKPSSWSVGGYPADRANHPVYSVEAHQAEMYCRWLSTRTKRTFRLPTEAEWEYAASSQAYEYPWGNEFDVECANTAELGLLTTSAVGVFSKGAASSGAMDMAGNVEEFVQEEYVPYPGGAFVVDDLNRNGSSYRIARGGSFGRFRDLARIRRRHGKVDDELYAAGFRVASDAYAR